MANFLLLIKRRILSSAILRHIRQSQNVAVRDCLYPRYGWLRFLTANFGLLYWILTIGRPVDNRGMAVFSLFECSYSPMSQPENRETPWVCRVKLMFSSWFTPLESFSGVSSPRLAACLLLRLKGEASFVTRIIHKAVGQAVCSSECCYFRYRMNNAG